MFYTSIRPGRNIGDPKVIDIAQLKYDSEGLFVKLKHTAEQWTTIPQRMKDVDVNCTRAPIYGAMKAFCIHTRTHSKPADLWCSDGLKEGLF